MAKEILKAVVVVADDEPSMLSLVSQHVENLGHQVYSAHDGEEAWEFVQRYVPNLVILDVMMPAMSGWEVCRKLRESPEFRHTGVIMLTGIGENLNELTSPLFGADAYLDKPFEFSVLDAAVKEVLAKRQQGKESSATAKEASTPVPPRAAGKSRSVSARKAEES
jgi:DNA-binding response OmpR family regulator